MTTRMKIVLYRLRGWARRNELKKKIWIGYCLFLLSLAMFIAGALVALADAGCI